MGVLDWFRNWLFGLDDLTNRAERMVYNQIPHLGSLFHYIRFFYLFASPMAFLVLGPLMLLEEPGASGIVKDLVLFVKEIIALDPHGIVRTFIGLFSYHFNVLIIGFIVACLGSWAGNLFDDYVRIDIEKVEKGYTKRYLSPILTGKVDKPFVRLSVVGFYALCAIFTVFLYILSRNLELVILITISNIGLSAYPDFYLPLFLQKKFGMSKKASEALGDFIQIYLYLIFSFYASWSIFKPVSAVPPGVHLLFHLIFISGYVAFEYMDWEADRNADHWTIANILPKKTTCYIGMILYALLIPFALVRSASFSQAALKLAIAFILWALSSLFLVTFYKKPMISMHGSYSLLCSYPIYIAALVLPKAELLAQLIFPYV